MMKLRLLEHGMWTVVAICDSRGDCPVQAFVHELESDGLSDYRQVMALLRTTAMTGPPKSEKRSRSLGDDIFELKTRGGIRVLYFYDEGRLVICTEAVRKPKERELRGVKTRAVDARRQYFAAKQRAALEIIEEDQ
jgi:hypothetical protein